MCTYFHAIICLDAFVGGLWLAACNAVVEMSTLMNDVSIINHYKDVVERGRKVYIEALWNGKYFNYDSSESAHHDRYNIFIQLSKDAHLTLADIYLFFVNGHSIMSDMMAGQWYSKVCKLPDIVPQHMVSSSLREIFQHNVIGASRSASKGDGDGNVGDVLLLGAVNGMRPDGSVDMSCLQSREVWTGTTYGLAALMIHESNKLSQESSSLTEPPTMISEYIKSTHKETLFHMGFSTAQVCMYK